MTDFLLQLLGTVIGSVGAMLIVIAALKRFLPGARAMTLDRPVDFVVSIVTIVILGLATSAIVGPQPPFVDGLIFGVCLSVGFNAPAVWSALRNRPDADSEPDDSTKTG